MPNLKAAGVSLKTKPLLHQKAKSDGSLTKGDSGRSQEGYRLSEVLFKEREKDQKNNESRHRVFLPCGSGLCFVLATGSRRVGPARPILLPWTRLASGAGPSGARRDGR